jgi:hypothetical protein
MVRARQGLGIVTTIAALAVGVVVAVATPAGLAAATPRSQASPHRSSATAATAPGLAWSTPRPIDTRALVVIRCPTTSFCAAIDDAGNLLTSKTPRALGKSWKKVHLDKAVTALACASTRLCVAVDSNGYVLTSRNPAGGAKTWTRTLVDTIVPRELSAVTCRSNLCITGDNQGNAFTSTNPTGGRHAWKVRSLPSNGDSAGVMSGFSCPLTSLCVGVDQSTGEGFMDDVFTSTHATVKNRWNLTAEFFNNSFNGVACPTKSLCVAPTDSGEVMTSTKPTRGSSWHAATLLSDDTSINTVACASASFCVLGDDDGGVETSTTPNAGANGWQSTSVAAKDAIESLACPSARLCFAVTGKGHVIVGSR